MRPLRQVLAEMRYEWQLMSPWERTMEVFEFGLIVTFCALVLMIA